jgi:xanthine/uracil permease
VSGGVFPVVGRVVASIPRPVFGGAALAMFALVAVVGLRILSRVDLTRTNNLMIIAASLGVGVIPSAAPGFYASLPEDLELLLNSGLVAGAIAAVTLNILFNHVSIGRPTNGEPARDRAIPTAPEATPAVAMETTG